VWAAESPHTLHLNLNVTIDESDPDPSVSSVMVMVTRGSPPTVLGSALVRQVVRRTSDGWGIASREILAAQSWGGRGKIAAGGRSWRPRRRASAATTAT
jgi:hypothetical protein